MVRGEPRKRENQTGVLRFKKGTQVKIIPHLSFVLQLMACLEANHSAIRWLGYVETESDLVKTLDKFMVWNAGLGWCYEAFKLLRTGQANGMIDRAVFKDPKQLELWDRITARKEDPLVSHLRDIRNKHFGHFDGHVMEQFIADQDRSGAREPFFVGDVEGKPLESRYLWPLAATIFDILPNPSDPERPRKIDDLLDAFEDVWAQTGNLIAVFIDSWLLTNQHHFEVVEGGIV